jgi:hypothetical protein
MQKLPSIDGSRKISRLLSLTTTLRGIGGAMLLSLLMQQNDVNHWTNQNHEKNSNP